MREVYICSLELLIIVFISVRAQASGRMPMRTQLLVTQNCNISCSKLLLATMMDGIRQPCIEIESNPHTKEHRHRIILRNHTISFPWHHGTDHHFPAVLRQHFNAPESHHHSPLGTKVSSSDTVPAINWCGFIQVSLPCTDGQLLQT